MSFRVNTALAIIIVTFAVGHAIPVYADEFIYCIEKTTQSQSWQKPRCIESVICEVPSPYAIFNADNLEFDYELSFVQYKTYCKDVHGNTQAVITPTLFNLKVWDSDYNYMTHNKTTSDIREIKLDLHKDIPYLIEIETVWQTANNETYQFAEDEYGNSIEGKPSIHIQKTNENVIVMFDY